MGAILWSHMGRMVFAASLEQLAARIDEIMVTSTDLVLAALIAWFFCQPPSRAGRSAARQKNDSEPDVRQGDHPEP
jgi:hypothetical protein